MLGAPAAVALALRRALVTAAANTAASRSSSVLTTTSTTTAAVAATASPSSSPLLWSRRALSSSSSSSSSSSTPLAADAAAADADAESRLRLANKLIYRAKQRGFLELDLLVGLWAERAIPRMASPPEQGGPPSPERARRALLDAQDLLDAENPDLFKWLTGQEAVPESMARNSAFADLHAHVQGQMREHAHPAARAARGAAWARGWDDYSSANNAAAGADGGGKEADGGGKEKEGAVVKGP